MAKRETSAKYFQKLQDIGPAETKAQCKNKRKDQCRGSCIWRPNLQRNDRKPACFVRKEGERTPTASPASQSPVPLAEPAPLPKTSNWNTLLRVGNGVLGTAATLVNATATGARYGAKGAATGFNWTKYGLQKTAGGIGWLASYAKGAKPSSAEQQLDTANRLADALSDWTEANPSAPEAPAVQEALEQVEPVLEQASLSPDRRTASFKSISPASAYLTPATAGKSIDRAHSLVKSLPRNPTPKQRAQVASAIATVQAAQEMQLIPAGTKAAKSLAALTKTLEASGVQARTKRANLAKFEKELLKSQRKLQSMMPKSAPGRKSLKTRRSPQATRTKAVRRVKSAKANLPTAAAAAKAKAKTTKRIATLLEQLQTKTLADARAKAAQRYNEESAQAAKRGQPFGKAQFTEKTTRRSPRARRR